MKNLKVGLLLHFYQPWWQYPCVLKEIAEQCYRPILRVIERAQGFCFSMNINYSLLELLNMEHSDVVAGFKNATNAGKIELLGSTTYHPIMPLVSSDMRMAQMKIDMQLKRTFCGIE